MVLHKKNDSGKGAETRSQSRGRTTGQGSQTAGSCSQHIKLTTHSPRSPSRDRRRQRGNQNKQSNANVNNLSNQPKATNQAQDNISSDNLPLSGQKPITGVQIINEMGKINGTNPQRMSLLHSTK